MVAVDVTVEECREVLRRFMLAPVSLSTLQPVLELGAKLNPDIETCSDCRTVIRPPACGPLCRGCRDRVFVQR